MTSQLVETSEEDSFLALARFIGALLDEGQVSRHDALLCLMHLAAGRDLLVRSTYIICIIFEINHRRASLTAELRCLQ